MSKQKRQRAARKGEAACSTCRWWDSSPFDERFLGLCRRNPPSVMRLWDDEPDARDSWPETTPVDWCGEHSTSNAKAHGRAVARTVQPLVRNGDSA